MVSFLALAACSHPNSNSSDDSPTLKALTNTCLDGNETNQVSAGLGDPFYVSSWHLKNTGKNQVVSASGGIEERNNANDDSVAGIDANVEEVHKNANGCTGKGVTVAIVDSGLEISHEDLNPNVIPNGSFNFLTKTDDPSPSPNTNILDHGTAVAGIVASRGWNGKGTRGVAPLAKLIGFPLVGVPFDNEIHGMLSSYLAFGHFSAAKAMNKVGNGLYTSMIDTFGQRSQKVDVFNFSAGSEYPSPPKFSETSSTHESFKYAAQVLRGGKGAVVIQAAGNEFEQFKRIDCERARIASLGLTFKNPALVTCGSSNHEPYGKPYAYQVSAIHNNGKASSYSSSGSDIWVTGFGGEFGTKEAAIITTDDTGCTSGGNNINSTSYVGIPAWALKRMIADQKGENTDDPNCNYTGRMNGTSSAAPSVSGVVALMLEANPKLTQQDVGYILAKTARKVDEDIAKDNKQPTVQKGTSTLELDLPWQINDAGFNFQSRYGFGLVDAKAAVEMAAKNYQPPEGRRLGKLTSYAPLAASEMKGSFEVASTQVVFNNTEQKTGMLRVELEIFNRDATNPLNSGYLQFELVNKTGKKSILLPAFTVWFTSTDSLIAPEKSKAFRFHTNAFYGENLGNYDLNVILVGDQKFGIKIAKLTSFSL